MQLKVTDYGLFFAGVGVGLATLVIEQAGLDLPTWLLVVLAVCALAMIVGGLLVPFWARKNAARTTDSSDPCQELLSHLARGARQLAHNLEHFPNWWYAIEDEGFKGKLPDGYGPTTHAKAMETLLFMFGQFFSAAWTYQCFCVGHQGRGEVKALVDDVYEALGNLGDPRDTTDTRIDSDQLHVIGEIGTRGWDTSEARPIKRSDFKAKFEFHAEAFEPLQAFLCAAGPGTGARRRLEAAEQAVKRVEDWLERNGHRP